MSNSRRRPAIRPPLGSGPAYVVLLPATGPLTVGVVAGLAELMGIDPYSARIRLTTPTPQLIRRLPSLPEAEAACAHMAEAGLAAFPLSQSELSSLAAEAAAAIAPGQGGLMLTLKSESDTILLSTGSVVALVRGEVVERITRDTEVADPRLGTVALGAERERTESDLVIDLHRSEPPKVVRIRQGSFDFGPLFRGRSTGTHALMQATWEWLRGVLPGAAWFDEFGRAEGMLDPGHMRDLGGASDLHEWSMSRPLLARLAVTRSRRILESNAQAYDLYSALCRFAALRARHAKSRAL